MKVLLSLVLSVLAISFLSAYSQTLESLQLTPTDDAFVTTNLSSPDTPVAEQNFGTGEFLKVWYSWNATGDGERIVSLAYLKYNITTLPENVTKAELRMYPYIVDSPSKVALYEVKDNLWQENTITYNSSKSFTPQPLAVTNISEKDNWYSWDITDHLSQLDTEASFVVSHQTLQAGKEQNMAFYSKDTTQKDMAPHLEIQYEKPQETNGGGCLIATATYGTELSSQVQQLRELRDNIILNTESGKSFMESFNQFYYAFSPYIADYERQNPAFKEMVKLGITPLVASLSILNHADIDTEYEMIGYGLGIITLNLAMYGAVPAVAITRIKKLYSQQ